MTKIILASFLNPFIRNQYENNYSTKVNNPYSVNGDVTLYALWSCEVKFDADGGTPVPNPDHYTYYEGSGTKTMPSAPAKKGYTFAGWKGDRTYDASAAFTPKPTNSIAAYKAQWDAITYDIVYDANGASGKVPDPIKNKPYGENVTLSDGSGLSKSYNVKFDSNSGSAVSDITASRKFLGWSESKTATTATYAGGAAVNNLTATQGATVTLYAVWDKKGPITLPTPSKANWTLDGWMYNGSNVGKGGTNYDVESDCTLTAKWTCTVTYNQNYTGGTTTSDTYIYGNAALKLPTVDRTGYQFNGWYTAASGGTRVGGAGDSCTPSGNVTLYAQWTKNSYTITATSLTNAKITVNYGDESTTIENNNGHVSVPFGTKVIIIPNYTKGSNQECIISDGSTTYNENKEFTMPAANITVTAYSDSGCFTGDTLITMADGTQKMMKDVALDEEVLVFNHETGKLDTARMGLIVHRSSEESLHSVMNLVFDDGRLFRIVNHHGLFDVNKNKYVYIDFDNYKDFIGHSFYFTDVADGKYSAGSVKLVDVYFTEEMVGAYAPISEYHLNCFANGLLSMTSSMDGLFNIFELDKNMKYDAEKMRVDISTYGLYSYADFKDYIPYYIYRYFPAEYFKVSVGKGMITFDHILELVKDFSIGAEIGHS